MKIKRILDRKRVFLFFFVGGVHNYVNEKLKKHAQFGKLPFALLFFQINFKYAVKKHLSFENLLINIFCSFTI